MAICGGLRSLFEKPLPENSTLMESLSSWNHIKPKNTVEPSSFTEIFGELHFQEKPVMSADTARAPSPPLKHAMNQSLWLDVSEHDDKEAEKCDMPSHDALLAVPKNHSTRIAAKSTNGSFSLKNSESIQLCTEGLGSESTDDVDDLEVDGYGDECSDHWKDNMNMERQLFHCICESDMKPRNVRGFPPPISSIGRGGKPIVCFRSFRENGRFVLMRIPGQELLHASREAGRLKLHFVHSDKAIAEAEEEGEKDEEECKNTDEKIVKREGEEREIVRV